MTVNYPEEILIEKGWMAYTNCEINNSGDSDLHNMIISVEGPYNWFEFQKNTTDIIPVNNTIEFTTKIYVPPETSIGSYNFSLKLKSNEMNAEKNFSVRVFETRDDLLLYQVNSLRGDLSDLEKEARSIENNGKNMTFAKGILDQISTKLDSAEEHITGKMYDNVTEDVRDAEKLFIEARFELSNSSRPSEILGIQLSPTILLIIAAIIIVLSIGVLTYLVRKNKIKNKVRTPNLKVKELVVDNQKIKELEQEIQKVKESQTMIEGEYRDNIISKESYDELKTKYQQKLMELESEIKKLRGY